MRRCERYHYRRRAFDGRSCVASMERRVMFVECCPPTPERFCVSEVADEMRHVPGTAVHVEKRTPSLSSNPYERY